MPSKKSDDYYVDLPDDITTTQLHQVIEQAAQSVGLYISHVGGYSRKKYPNSVHWHFKRDPKESGLLDATFWDIKNLFWLMIRHREPQWVHEMVPRFLAAISRELNRT